MLSTIEIVLLIVIIIIIGLAIYIITRHNIDNKTKLLIALENITKTFGLKTEENFSQENLDTNIVFNNGEDVVKNMPTFIEYAFNGIDLNEIDKILKENGLNKTALQIFDEHKNDAYNNFKTKFNLLSLLSLYSNYLFEGTDQEIKDKIKLYFIVMLAFNNKIEPINSIQLPKTITDEGNTYTVDKTNLVLNNDYQTSDNLILYLRTNLNNSIKLEDAIVSNSINNDECFIPTKLCKNTTSIQKIIDENKTKAINNMSDIKRLFNLLFSKNLFNLNNTTIPDNIITEITTLTTKLGNNGIGY